MAAVNAQAGRISRLGGAKETTDLTYLAPTHEIRAETTDLTDDPMIVEFESENGTRDPIDDTREGIHKVDFKFTTAMRPLQGAWLWPIALGNDIISGVTALSATLSADVAVGDTTLTFASLPALPSGVAEWAGCWIDVDTAGAHPERKYILGVAGAVVRVTPMAFTHDHTLAVNSIPIQHIVQPNVGALVDYLNCASFCAQYGTLYEKQLAGCQPSKVGLKGDSKTIKLNWEFSGQVIPVTNSPVSSFSAAANELADRPFILRDGGLLTPFTPGDTVPATMHNRILTLDYELANDLKAREYGGGAQNAEQYVPIDRTQSIKWTEDAGQNSANPDIYTNYVRSQAYMAAYFAFLNPTTNYAVGMWFPKCAVEKYKDVMGPKDVIGYEGELKPLSDKAGSGKSVKLAIVNSLVTAY